MKLCCNCKHYRPVFMAYYVKCNFRQEPVDGGPRDYADHARRYNGHCGPDGKNFEQEKTIWMTIKETFQK